MRAKKGAAGRKAPTDDLGVAEALRLKADVESCSEAQLLELLEAATPCTAKACKGRRDNPNCLCGLAPAPGAFRRKGLWQRDLSALLCLGGSDPADLQRKARLAAHCLVICWILQPLIIMGSSRAAIRRRPATRRRA